ncbi:MAG TPA: DUF4190 domain-containing protein [Microbacterium sp.]|nr:DUF4190 domain-containing protein [Microbacterium sp.]
MTDPNTPAPDAQQPPIQPPPAPQYGEYAPNTGAATPSEPSQPAYSAPAYSAPAYSAAPAYDASAYGSAPGAPVPGKTLGIVAFILSFFVQLVALILGIVALVQSRKAGVKNGFALAAIIISSVIIVLGIIAIILFFALFAAAGGTDLVNQVNACLSDPTGSVVVNGLTMSCEEILEQSGR